MTARSADADYLVVVTDTDNVLGELTKTDGPNDGAEGNSQDHPVCDYAGRRGNHRTT